MWTSWGQTFWGRPSKSWKTRIFRVGFWQNGFFADFYFWAAGFFRGFSRRIFSHFCGKKCPEKSSRKISGKILQNLCNKNPPTHFCRMAGAKIWVRTSMPDFAPILLSLMCPLPTPSTNRRLGCHKWGFKRWGFKEIRGYLRKKAFFLRFLDFPGALRTLRKRAKKAEKGRKRQKKGEKGRFRPISGKGGQTPLEPPFVTPPFAAAQAEVSLRPFGGEVFRGLVSKGRKYIQKAFSALRNQVPQQAKKRFGVYQKSLIYRERGENTFTPKSLPHGIDV